MNNLYQQEFVNQALKSGVPQQKVAALLQRAEEIANRPSKTTKTAATKLDLVDSLITGAGLEKSASSVSYVQGILNEAFTGGANLPQAISFTKQALDATSKRLAFMEKVSAIANNPQLNQYAEGFITTAKTAGLSQDEAVSLLVDVVDREKAAADSPDMFKQAPGGTPGGAPAPQDDPAAGAPPSGPGGDPAAGGNPEEAQILQMLQSLPPEEQQQIIQQLLAAISGGAGGQGGPGAGGPPPAMAGPGGPGGAPQPGGPQGPV